MHAPQKISLISVDTMCYSKMGLGRDARSFYVPTTLRRYAHADHGWDFFCMSRGLRMAMTKAEMHKTICAELTALYERKNHDYGDSFGKSYAEYGMAMPCIRLEDKLNRLKSLTRKIQQVQDESVEDTLMDLANYAIMTVVEMRSHGVND